MTKESGDSRPVYAFGSGPIDRLCLRVMDGELNIQQAEREAPTLLRDAQVSPDVLATLSAFAVQTSHEGHWQEGVVLARLLAAALDDVDGDDADLALVRAVVSCDLLEVAKAALKIAPDLELYERACRAGEWSLAWGRQHRDDRIVSAALFRLGTMHLDPYTAGRSSTSYWRQHDEWLRRGGAVAEDLYRYSEVKITGNRLGLVNPKLMPEPLVALREAERYLRLAAEIRQGEERGYALKALIQTLAYRKVLGDAIDSQELAGLCAKALDLLPDSDIGSRAYVTSALQLVSDVVLDPELLDRLEKNLDEHIAAVGPNEAIAAMHMVLQALGRREPKRALELARRGRSLVIRYGDESRRESQFGFELVLITRVHAGIWQLDPTMTDDTIVDSIANDERHSPRERAAALVEIARRVLDRGAVPSVGLEALRAATRVDNALVEEYAAACLYLRARLLAMHAGSSAAQDRRGGTKRASAAMVDFLALDLPQLALSTLEAIIAQNEELDEETALTVLTDLYYAGNQLALVDREGVRLLQVVCGQLLSALRRACASVHAFLMLSQVAKGALLAAALTRDPPVLGDLDEYGHELLAEITAAERELPTDVSAPGALESDSLGEDQTLVGWIDTAEFQPANTLTDRLRNRQAGFERHLVRLLRVDQAALPAPLTLADVMAILDERTVLLIELTGYSVRGLPAETFLLITRESGAIGTVESDMPPGEVRVSYRERSVITSYLGQLVADLRSAIQRVPEATERLVDSVAAQELANTDRYFAGLWAKLGQLRDEGKDCLWIVPHGATHYFPFHLVGPEGSPLAASWRITYLPNLGLLRPRGQRGGAASRRRVRITSFGVTYRNGPHPECEVLDEAAAEATDVAAAFDATPILDADVTKRRVLDALHRSRYVHLAAHGRHNVNAPAFQTVLLGGAGDEAYLFAHEILSHDLRGLELVTLSACETALGRFDRNDNLRGLPAALLLAGVQTIVGTLWPVDNDAAAAFFPALYQRLAVDRDIDVSDAFRSAQAVTRSSFPDYRDWGAFCLIGGIPR